MKNVERLLVLIVLLSLIITGCQPAAPQPAEDGKTPDASGEVQPEEQVTITVWDFGGAEFEWIELDRHSGIQQKVPKHQG